MQQRLTTFCVNGHEIFEMCVETDCHHPFGICRDQARDYSKLHRECHGLCTNQYILGSIMDFARQKSQIMDFIVIGSIDMMVKVLQPLKTEYLIKCRSLEDHLRGNKKQLFQLLKNGPAWHVHSLQINKVFAGREASNRQAQSIQKFKKKTMEMVEKLQRQGLEEVQRLIKGFEFVFDDELTRKEEVEITNWGRSLRKKSQSSHNISLISPPLFDTKNLKLTLRLTHKQSNKICLGLVKRDQIQKSNVNFPLNYQRINGIWSTGEIFNPSYPQQHKKQTDFTFSQGDVITMEKKQSSNSLLITNLTNKKTVSLRNRFNYHRDWHYFVHTSSKDDKWEIIVEI